MATPSVETLPDLARMLDARYAFQRVLLVRSAVTGPFLDTMLEERPRQEKRIVRYAPNKSPSLPAVHPTQQSDFIALDPWHTFAQSQQDLASMAARLHEDGILVIHDCNPPSVDVCSPTFQAGTWCGVTYVALVDFLVSHAQEGWMCAVLPQDFGIAMLCRKPNSRHYPFVQPLAADDETRGLRREFLRLFHSGDEKASFEFYQKYASRMVNLLQ